MKRIVNFYLNQWKNMSSRKPLLLRGARQVGKTYAVRELGSTFEHFIEINFEERPAAIAIFDQDLDPERIIRDLSILMQRPITSENTLLFFDEIQAAPKALTALRYFYEKMPELHIIGAGSLLDFSIQQMGFPVGRVNSFYMYPLSFIEFLLALGHDMLAQELVNFSQDTNFSTVIHTQALRLVGEYIAIGGMPEVVKNWRDTKDPFSCFVKQHTIIDAYRHDFNKYASKYQIKYVNLLFEKLPLHLGHKFKYSSISTEYRKRELEPSLDLLTTAGIVHKIMHSAGQGIPLGAQANPDDFKALFLDIGLAQTLLGFSKTPTHAAWLLNPLEEFINKGELCEAFVGQEILAYSYPLVKPQLYYWHRESRSSQAEIDYLIQKEEHVIPVEAKSGEGSTLRSMHLFLDSHTQSPYGIRFSTQPYSLYQKIHSYPLYAIASALKISPIQLD